MNYIFALLLVVGAIASAQNKNFGMLDYVRGPDGKYYQKVWNGKKYVWEEAKTIYSNGVKWDLSKTTVNDGLTYRTYTNQDGDQVVIKPRTDRSPDPQELPTAANLPNRQSIFEFGIGYGYASASARSLKYTANGKTGEFGAIYDGSPTSYHHPMMSDIQFAIHPPFKALARTTFGVNATGSMAMDPDGNGTNIFATNPDGSQGPLIGSTGAHKAAPGISINAIVTEDFWYIPATSSTSIFSAGAYYGYKSAQFQAGPNSTEYGPFRPDKGAVIRYRFVRGDDYKSFANIYVQAMISTDRSYKISLGWNMSWGRPNAPKTRKVK